MAEDDADRGAQLMGDIDRHLAPQGLRARQVGAHAVEGSGKLDITTPKKHTNGKEKENA